jgi:hypothetical protein
VIGKIIRLNITNAVVRTNNVEVHRTQGAPKRPDGNVAAINPRAGSVPENAHADSQAARSEAGKEPVWLSATKYASAEAATANQAAYTTMAIPILFPGRRQTTRAPTTGQPSKRMV